jgi:GcrA cell cycle regulator
MTCPWNDQNTKQLCRMWAEGMSAAQIAAEFSGISRNAVLGKVHRLRASGVTLGRRPQVPAKPKASRSRPALPPRVAFMSLPAIRKPTPKRAPALPPDKSTHCTLMDLNDKRCRWPIGDPQKAHMLYCGATPEAGKSYCPHHCRIAEAA